MAAVEDWQRHPNAGAGDPYLHVSMKRFRCKTLLRRPWKAESEENKEEGFVSWNQRMGIWAGGMVLMLAASLPSAAQAVPQARPGIPASMPNAPTAGDMFMIVKEAEGWLAELIKINTSNPPGNEQAAAKYVVG